MIWDIFGERGLIKIPTIKYARRHQGLYNSVAPMTYSMFTMSTGLPVQLGQVWLSFGWDTMVKGHAQVIKHWLPIDFILVFVIFPLGFPSWTVIWKEKVR